MANLLTNALKYSPANKKIIIKVEKIRKHLVISVQDFGMGIDKSEQKKIFDRLYQAGDTKTKTFPGLGLGLYISKEIVKWHKGRLWVKSSPGKGSIFYFTLPLNEIKDKI